MLHVIAGFLLTIVVAVVVMVMMKLLEVASAEAFVEQAKLKEEIDNIKSEVTGDDD